MAKSSEEVTGTFRNATSIYFHKSLIEETYRGVEGRYNY